MPRGRSQTDVWKLRSLTATIRITLPNCQHLYLQARIFVRACEAQQINQDWDLEDFDFEEMQASRCLWLASNLWSLYLSSKIAQLYRTWCVYMCTVYMSNIYCTLLCYIWIAIPMASRNSSILILTLWGCSAHQWRHLSRQEASWWLTQQRPDSS